MIQWGQRFDSFPILERVRRICGFSGPITFGASNGIFGNSVIKLHSRHLAISAHKLLKCETNRKTFDLEFPHDVPSEFVSSLVRGIHDGDGSWVLKCCHSGQITFTITSASPKFLEGIRSCINKHALSTTAQRGSVRRNLNGCYGLFYETRSEMSTIGEWMYENGQQHDAFMEQKLSRFHFFQEMYANEDNASVPERIDKAILFKKKEKYEKDKTLNRLILISQNKLPCPDHFHFAPQFLRSFVDR